jgi:hypothetical protein
MLYDFLAANRADLVSRCRQKASQRHAPQTSEAELERGIPLFLDQLIKILKIEQRGEARPGQPGSSASDGDEAASELAMATAATAHGHNLMAQGCTVDQVVHAYGDVCQSVTDLACEHHTSISTDEFRTLNRCLDNVIADAVTGYSRSYNDEAATKSVHTESKRAETLARELRDLLHTATVAIEAIKSGNVGLSGATGSLLDRCMVAMREVIDASIADVHATAGSRPPR